MDDQHAKGNTTTNTRSIWFKRDRYGWGWVPVKWQGCAYILVFIIVAGGIPILAIQLFDASTNTAITMLIGLSLLMTMGAYRVAPLKRWRWGRSPEDNPEEDF